MSAGRQHCAGVERRLRQFETAIEYDMERTHPASEEARAVWLCILDKPQFALPEIQALIDRTK